MTAFEIYFKVKWYLYINISNNIHNLINLNKIWFKEKVSLQIWYQNIWYKFISQNNAIK